MTREPMNLLVVDSQARADSIMVERFRRQALKQPGRAVWAAYAFRTLTQPEGSRWGKPRRVFRLMVHIPGETDLTGMVQAYGWRHWPLWRLQTLLLTFRPDTDRLWAGKGMAAG